MRVLLAGRVLSGLSVCTSPVNLQNFMFLKNKQTKDILVSRLILAHRAFEIWVLCECGNLTLTEL